MNKNLPTSSQYVQTVANRILAAKEFTKIREMEDPYPMLNGLIARLILLHNVKGDDKPDEPYHRILLEALAKYHANWTVEEIYLACELNINGKLQTKTEHFGKITADYISACLHLYGEARKAAILAERSRSNRQSHTDLNYSSTPEAHYMHIVDFVKIANRLPDYWDWSIVYDYMTERKMLLHITAAQKHALKARMEDKVRADQAVSKIGSDPIAFRMLEGKSFDERVILECKKSIILEYLNDNYLNKNHEPAV